MAQLTTASAVFAYLGIISPTDQQTAQVTALIVSASARIENWCNRIFQAQDVIEWKDGGCNITAKFTPINSIKRIGVVDGTYFNVTYTGTDPWASVEVNAGLNGLPGNLTLVSSTAGVTVIPLTGLIQDVIAAINAVSGWTSTNNGQQINGRAAWIPPMAGTDATLNPSAVGNGAGPVQVPVCMGQLPIARYDYASGVIQLQNTGGFFSMSGWAWGGGALGGAGPIGDWGINRQEDGQTEFPRQFRGIVLDYNGGMGTIPADVAQTCIELVQMMMQSAANTGLLLGGESIGGYSYTNAGGSSGGRGGPSGGPAGVQSGWDQLIKDRLAGYVRIPLSD